MPTTKDKLTLSVNEAAELIDVHHTTLRRMLREEGIPHFRLGPGPRSVIRIPLRSFEEWLEDHAKAGATRGGWSG